MDCKINKKSLDNLYKNYNKRVLVNPDPLIFLYSYEVPKDREIVALISASLAYGRVSQILKSIDIVLKKLGESPSEYLKYTKEADIKKNLKGFRHRFTSDEEISKFLIGIKRTIIKHESLQNLFYKNINNDDENVLNSLSKFVTEIKEQGDLKKSSLLSDPQKGSACKRLNLFLRWMIRTDEVDPGGWTMISPKKLIIPLDTHMYQFAKIYKITNRKNADIKTAIQITNFFKKICPNDPVKYDFSITRFGIHPELCLKDLVKNL
jgi:uncharacterized protein (TIGR02757 family)